MLLTEGPGSTCSEFFVSLLMTEELYKKKCKKRECIFKRSTDKEIERPSGHTNTRCISQITFRWKYVPAPSQKVLLQNQERKASISPLRKEHRHKFTETNRPALTSNTWVLTYCSKESIFHANSTDNSFCLLPWAVALCL